MLQLSRITPNLKLKVSKRARRMALRLDAQRGVMNLVVPPRANLSKAFDFARTHKDWIIEKLASLPQPVPFLQGAIVPVLGLNRRIKIVRRKSVRTTDISLTRGKILVITNKDDPSGRIARFLREKAREKVTQLAHEKAARVGRKINTVQIRDTKTRWGSCATGGHLSFSWRLIFAPYSALDYVVAHEVAHLVHMNHGPKFWELCEELSLHYEAGKSWMRDHGHTLMRYGMTVDPE